MLDKMLPQQLALQKYRLVQVLDLKIGVYFPVTLLIYSISKRSLLEDFLAALIVELYLGRLGRTWISDEDKHALANPVDQVEVFAHLLP